MVLIADQHQARAGGQSRDQIRTQPDVDHGRLVDHQQIGVERALGVAPEHALGGPPFEQAVQGGGGLAGGFLHALGRAPGGRRQGHAQLAVEKGRDDAAHDGGLANAGAAGDDQQGLDQRAANGLGLASVMLASFS